LPTKIEKQSVKVCRHGDPNREKEPEATELIFIGTEQHNPSPIEQYPVDYIRIHAAEVIFAVRNGRGFDSRVTQDEHSG